MRIGLVLAIVAAVTAGFVGGGFDRVTARQTAQTPSPDRLRFQLIGNERGLVRTGDRYVAFVRAGGRPVVRPRHGPWPGRADVSSQPVRR